MVLLASAFGLPRKITPAQVIELSCTNYVYKVLIAVATLPANYLGHALLKRWMSADSPAPAAALAAEGE